MIQVTIVYLDGSVQNIQGVNFQQGDKALSITTAQGTLVGVPNSQVKVYEVKKIEEETTQPDGQDVVEPEVSAEDNTIKEKGNSEKEEA